MINLSPRLKQISSFVKDNSKIIDIGCDHGLVDIHLMQTKQNLKILATDINQNALNNAINNIKKYKLTNKIKTQVSDGLKDIDTKDYNTLIISGMGAHTIVGILSSSIKKLASIETIIIQSNNDIEFLREKITKLNYYIEDEELVKERKFIYTVIKFKKGKRRYTKKQLYFGPILLEKNNKIFQEKNKTDKEKLTILYNLIPKIHYKLRLKTYLKLKKYKNI